MAGLRIGSAFELGDDILGGEFAAVVKNDIFAQFEAPLESVFAQFPTLGECGDNRAFLVKTHQTFKHVVIHHAGDFLRGRNRWVPTRRLGGDGDGDAAALCGVLG